MFNADAYAAEPDSSEHRDFHGASGTTDNLAFSHEPAPRPPDADQIRAYLRGELDTALDEELFWLMKTFREWAEARDRVIANPQDVMPTDS